MPLPVTFGALASPVALSDLDDNFAAVGALATIVATIAGTNALTLTLAANTPTISAYANYLRFAGIAASDSSSTVTAQVGALAALPVYKDGINGPEVLFGGEIQSGALVILTCDSALNGGSGGFHLQTGSPILKGQTLNPGAIFIGASGGTLSAMIPRNTTTLTGVSLAFSIAGANSSTDVTSTLAGVSLGDYVVVAPPAAAMTAGLGYSGWVPAAGSVTVRQLNVTAATIGTINGTFGITALRIR